MRPPNLRSIRLWRRCVRCSKVMEPDMAEYYKGYAYSRIMSHFQEINPVRVEYLQGKGEENLQWIMGKYQLKEPIRHIDIVDGTKEADDAKVLPTAATGPTEATAGVFQTEERDDGLGCKGRDKVWMPAGAADKPMVWGTRSPKIVVGGKRVDTEDNNWQPPRR